MIGRAGGGNRTVQTGPQGGTVNILMLRKGQTVLDSSAQELQLGLPGMHLEPIFPVLCESFSLQACTHLNFGTDTQGCHGPSYMAFAVFI